CLSRTRTRNRRAMLFLSSGVILLPRTGALRVRVSSQRWDSLADPQADGLVVQPGVLARHSGGGVILWSVAGSAGSARPPCGRGPDSSVRHERGSEALPSARPPGASLPTHGEMVSESALRGSQPLHDADGEADGVTKRG